MKHLSRWTLPVLIVLFVSACQSLSNDRTEVVVSAEEMSQLGEILAEAGDDEIVFYAAKKKKGGKKPKGSRGVKRLCCSATKTEGDTTTEMSCYSRGNCSDCLRACERYGSSTMTTL